MTKRKVFKTGFLVYFKKMKRLADRVVASGSSVVLPSLGSGETDEPGFEVQLPVGEAQDGEVVAESASTPYASGWRKARNIAACALVPVLGFGAWKVNKNDINVFGESYRVPLLGNVVGKLLPEYSLLKAINNFSKRELAKYALEGEEMNNFFRSLRDELGFSREKAPSEPSIDFPGVGESFAEAPPIISPSPVPFVHIPGEKIPNRIRELEIKRNERVKRVLSLYETFLEKHPKSDSAWNMLGRVYYGQDKVLLAEECWEKALKINPKNGLALNSLAVLHAHGDVMGESLDYGRRAIEASPQLPVNHRNMALMLEFIDGDLKGALKSYVDAFKLEPSYTHAKDIAGWYYQEAFFPKVSPNTLENKTAKARKAVRWFEELGSLAKGDEEKRIAGVNLNSAKGLLSRIERKN